MKTTLFLILSLLLLAWAGCSSNQDKKQEQAEGPGPDLAVTNVVPAIAQNVPEIEAAIREYLGKDFEQLGESDTRYAFSKLDMNNDGRAELMVFMPGEYFCREGGCTLFLIREGSKGFEVFSKIAPVQTPVMVSAQATEGWKDLVVNAAQEGEPTELRVLSFDGSSYPSNPRKGAAQTSGGPIEAEEHLVGARELNVVFKK